MKDVMIDLETLGTRYDAQIIQIGACYFDRNTGEIGLGFSANIDGALQDEFTTDYSTIKWWFEQSDSARMLVMENPIPLPQALGELSRFLMGKDIQLWSHATFDIPILMNAFNVVGIPCPVPFRNMRDLRTLMDLASFGGKSATPSKVRREGVHHNALDDAKFQAAYAAEALIKLNARS